ncbi:hypothetical protein AD006_28675 (plasmid) [Pseudonocardia sp. EC080610-09]|uniref:hypothetical protein n=1 Tax=unclassified Pseudonocardia TaxID=2619320 RepID=UPI0007067946|nr:MULTISPECIES: hypothetical protein [unclassified Pseudonocardia]ALL79295.1 hypothetical protein AD006_28675 [Pseudonocardia sp. EC080610-09]ALL85265.1 hypothetical protein AD017_29065 [Pseudonocardia sp. EC080619-01]
MNPTVHSASPLENRFTTPNTGGVAALTSLVVRVAGHVPTGLDLRHAGTPEQQLGLTLGGVLVYLRSHHTAQLIDRAWAHAAPMTQSLNPHLVGRRRGIMTTGPWAATALVRIGGSPQLRAALLPATAGHHRPAILRLELGPIAWELCDAASYTALRRAWNTAANLLATTDTPAADTPAA